MIAKTSFKSGFSLIEVVLALGVCTIALVSIIGLLGVAVGTNGDAGRDTTLAAMSQHTLSDLRSAPFDALWEEEPRKSEATQPPANADVAAETTYYFTQEGTLTPTPADAFYKCVVEKIPDQKTRSADDGPYNQLRLSLVFRWPHDAPETDARSHTIYASVARY